MKFGVRRGKTPLRTPNFALISSGLSGGMSNCIGGKNKSGAVDVKGARINYNMLLAAAATIVDVAPQGELVPIRWIKTCIAPSPGQSLVRLSNKAWRGPKSFLPPKITG